MKTRIYASPLGEMLILADDKALKGLWFKDQKYYMKGFENVEAVDGDSSVLDKAVAWLDLYFKGENPAWEDLPLNADGTAFQKAVWDILLKVPYGKTISYSEIAKEIAVSRGLKSMSSQAVGSAVGQNPISIIIPCHRVLGKTGSLTGYAGGLDRKEALLRLEAVL